MGADQNAWAQASQMGFFFNNVRSFNAMDIKDRFSSTLSTATSYYVGSSEATMANTFNSSYAKGYDPTNPDQQDIPIPAKPKRVRKQPKVTA